MAHHISEVPFKLKQQPGLRIELHLGLIHFSEDLSKGATLLKSNMSPSNQWLEDVLPVKRVPFKGTFVSFQGCMFCLGRVLLRRVLLFLGGPNVYPQVTLLGFGRLVNVRGDSKTHQRENERMQHVNFDKSSSKMGCSNYIIGVITFKSITPQKTLHIYVWYFLEKKSSSKTLCQSSFEVVLII